MYSSASLGKRRLDALRSLLRDCSCICCIRVLCSWLVLFFRVLRVLDLDWYGDGPIAELEFPVSLPPLRFVLFFCPLLSWLERPLPSHSRPCLELEHEPGKSERISKARMRSLLYENSCCRIIEFFREAFSWSFTSPRYNTMGPSLANLLLINMVCLQYVIVTELAFILPTWNFKKCRVSFQCWWFNVWQSCDWLKIMLLIKYTCVIYLWH